MYQVVIVKITSAKLFLNVPDSVAVDIIDPVGARVILQKIEPVSKEMSK